MKKKIASILLVTTFGIGCIACGDTKLDTTISNKQSTVEAESKEEVAQSDNKMDEQLTETTEESNDSLDDDKNKNKKWWWETVDWASVEDAKFENFKFYDTNEYENITFQYIKDNYYAKRELENDYEYVDVEEYINGLTEEYLHPSGCFSVALAPKKDVDESKDHRAFTTLILELYNFGDEYISGMERIERNWFQIGAVEGDLYVMELPPKCDAIGFMHLDKFVKRYGRPTSIYSYTPDISFQPALSLDTNSIRTHNSHNMLIYEFENCVMTVDENEEILSKNTVIWEDSFYHLDINIYPKEAWKQYSAIEYMNPEKFEFFEVIDVDTLIERIQ